MYSFTAGYLIKISTPRVILFNSQDHPSMNITGLMVFQNNQNNKNVLSENCQQYEVIPNLINHDPRPVNRNFEWISLENFLS